MKKRLLGTTAVFVLAATALLAAPASADTLEEADEVILVKMIDGVMTPISEEFQESAGLNVVAPAPIDPDLVTPNLIGFNVWADCYLANNENLEFSLYTRFWNGVGKDVRLKCGNKYWGYKHIQIGKQADWQKKLDNARNAGWNVGSIANGGSWDDLMNAATASAITWPDHWTTRATNSTTCVFANLHFYNTSTGTIVYSFNVRAGYANDSDKLITSFPTSGTKCPA